ncbi:MAG TPA: hypothetical protein VK467_05720, partial [Gemmatimonadales bacterium]|nr:hypothetical protein [Gemmatimonadales bacterium]
MRSMTPRFLAIIVSLFATATCDDALGPTGPPGITIVAGADLADTVDARPAQALLVEIHTAAGAPASRAVVRFTGLLASNSPYPQTSIRVGRIDGQPNQGFVVDTTDARGRAHIVVAMGAVAGPGGVEVTVPDLGFSDTAAYTINPGNGVRVVGVPADTVVYVARSFALRASVRDRYGNPRLDPLTFESDSTSASVSPAGDVTGAAIGRARVLMRDAVGHADTTATRWRSC